MPFSAAALLSSALCLASASARFVMYADEWHPTRPTNAADRAGIDHVVLAFAMANATAAFQPKVPITTIRSEFPNAKVMIAVGGWGDDIGFSELSKTDASIKQFANDIATMLTNTGADGVDIDWEYPGGNGADYKQNPNSGKVYQIEAFPNVLASIRSAIGNKLLSIAVPGKKGDMLGFTEDTSPKIWPSVDYINARCTVMSYDLMNRRDTVTNHHTSVVGSEDTIKNYLDLGAPPEKINLGFAYYAKYFTTQGDCSSNPLGCPIVAAEDPVTGKDTLTSGAWTFETYHVKPVDTSRLVPSYDGTCGPEKNTKCTTGCCSQYGNCGTSPEHCSGACQHAFGTGCTDSDVAGSWQNALANGVTDEEAGGQYYFDPQNKLFWTWDTPALISRKFDQIVRKYKLGGVMAWSLGEDSYDWSHIKAMASELAKGTTEYPTHDEPSSHHSRPKEPVQAPEDYEPSPPKTHPTHQDPPLFESGPASSIAPASRPDSKDGPGVRPQRPWKEVYVDGSEDGPDAEYDNTSGAPSSYVDYHDEAPESVEPAPRPAVEPAPQPVAEQASTPQQNAPVSGGSSKELPFSPEYAAALKTFGDDGSGSAKHRMAGSAFRRRKAAV